MVHSFSKPIGNCDIEITSSAHCNSVLESEAELKKCDTECSTLTRNPKLASQLL